MKQESFSKDTKASSIDNNGLTYPQAIPFKNQSLYFSDMITA